jgi:hypothetical protein
MAPCFEFYKLSALSPSLGIRYPRIFVEIIGAERVEYSYVLYYFMLLFLEVPERDQDSVRCFLLLTIVLRT